MKKWFRHVVFVIYVTIAFFASNLGDIPSLFSHKNLGGDNSLYAMQKKVAKKKAATKKVKKKATKKKKPAPKKVKKKATKKKKPAPK